MNCIALFAVIRTCYTDARIRCGEHKVKVVFHLGLTKTGSTTIQEMLSLNFASLNKRMSLAVKDARAEKLRNAGKACAEKQDWSSRRRLKKETKAFFDWVSAEGKEVALYSDETTFGGIPYWSSGHIFEQGNSVLSIIERTGRAFDLEFVFYYRDFERWERSVYNQMVKWDGYAETFEYWQNHQPYPQDWDRNFEQLTHGLKTPVTLVKMEDEVANGVLGYTLLHKAGLTMHEFEQLEQPRPANVSLNKAQLEFMRVVNKLDLDTVQRRAVAKVVVEQQALFGRGL